VRGKKKNGKEAVQLTMIWRWLGRAVGGMERNLGRKGEGADLLPWGRVTQKKKKKNATKGKGGGGQKKAGICPGIASTKTTTVGKRYRFP